MIVDIHTHNSAAHDAIKSVEPQVFHPNDGCYYSVGIHPWNAHDNTNAIDLLSQVASHQSVIAIGETGIDNLKDKTTHAIQLELFKYHIELSEKLKKPLIIHSVKSHDDIIRIKKTINPTQQWIIHGFRGNPNIATLFINAGIALSFGERFNPLSLAVTPLTSMFVETDESTLSINEIYTNIAAQIPCTIPNLIAQVSQNISTTFRLL